MARSNKSSFDRLYTGLVENWMRHQELKSSRSGYRELVDSWMSVKDSRAEMRKWWVDRGLEVR